MSNTIWFVYPRGDGHTNEVIAERLPGETTEEVLCIDGKRRPMWVVRHIFITELKKNREFAHLDFEVWYRERRTAPARKWKFLDKQKPTLASALKKRNVFKLSQSREGA